MIKEKSTKQVLVFLSANLQARTLALIVGKLIKDEKTHVKIVNDNYGTCVLDELGFPYEVIAPPFSEGVAEYIDGADIVVSGKTYIREAENILMEQCEKKGVPYAMVVADIGGQIAFAKFQGEKPDGSLLLPTHIFITDSATHDYLIEKGLSPDMLIPGGNPYFDSLAARASTAPRTSGNVVPLITYMDCPFEWDFEQKLLPAGPYSQKQFVDEVVQAVPKGVDLQMKFHPRSKEEHFISAQEKGVKQVKTDSFTAILNSDVVLSSYSTTLLEAALAGVPAISYQPWDNERIRKDVFNGVVPIVDNPGALKEHIEKALESFGSTRKLNGKVLYNLGNSTKSIVESVYRILKVI